jgi:hypothetical protein
MHTSNEVCVGGHEIGTRLTATCQNRSEHSITCVTWNACGTDDKAAKERLGIGGIRASIAAHECEWISVRACSD